MKIANVKVEGLHETMKKEKGIINSAVAANNFELIILFGQINAYCIDCRRQDIYQDN